MPYTGEVINTSDWRDFENPAESDTAILQGHQAGYALVHRHRMTDALASATSAGATFDTERNVYFIPGKGTEILIPAQTTKKVKDGKQVEEIKPLTPFGVNISKLEEWINHSFTSTVMPRDIKNLTKEKRTIRFSIREFAYRCNKHTEIDPSAPDQEKEANRVKDNRKDFRKQIGRTLDTFTAMRVRYIDEDGILNEGKNYIAEWKVDKTFFGFVEVLLTDPYAEALLKSPTSPLPYALFQIDARDSNTYSLGYNMARYYNMDSNIKSHQNNRLAVRTLLKYVDLPTFEEVNAKDRGNWVARIREPLEKYLVKLTKIGVFKEIPHYVESGGMALGPHEVDLRNYEDWLNLYVEFEIRPDNAPDQAKRIKQKEENRKEALKKSRKARKGTSTSKKKTSKPAVDAIDEQDEIKAPAGPPPRPRKD